MFCFRVLTEADSKILEHMVDNKSTAFVSKYLINRNRMRTFTFATVPF